VWAGRALGQVSEIIERGTYLDAEDVAAFSRLALPGIDEMMAVLRLADLADASTERRRVVVDTAPTGHTLRLLDAAATHEAIARALRAMADKAAAVAGALTGRAVRMRGEDIIDELERYVTTYRMRVLAPAAFFVATRPGSVVEAETERLAGQLQQRGLRIAGLISAGAGEPGRRLLPAAPHLVVPLLEDATGCAGLRRWREHVRSGRGEPAGPGPQGAAGGETAGPGPQGAAGGETAGPRPQGAAGGETAAPGPQGGTAAAGPGPGAREWLASHAPRLLLFAGKGGVGKSTCAAAAALALAATRDVLLCSTDPAGSLDDVFARTAGRPAARLRVMQIDPGALFDRLRDSYHADVVAALDRLGLSESAALDRRVIDALWDLAPPGIDELAATAAMLGASASEETVVVDSSPTGHFLRLLEMPDVALGWTRQLMRVIVKYGIAGVAGDAAESLLELARRLRALRDALRDEASASVIVVTLDEPMVRAETERLVASLDAAQIRIGAVLLNRFTATAPAGEQEAAGWSGADALIYAPVTDPPPVGEHA
ncbi:MAG: ArsA-related P-loop ATPase, partial [Longimicrobiales bacterium]